MCKSILSRVFAFIGVLGTAIFIQSCSKGASSETGELVGAPDREGWVVTVPYGMVVCPSGTFHMGQADEDISHSRNNQNKQVTIGGFYMDDTEITNNEYRQFVQAMLTDSSALGVDVIMKEYYPDTTVWVRDFSHHMGDPMMEYYYAHPAFDDYPVVGVDWFAAKKFCEWRTNFLNDYRQNTANLFRMPDLRLPSEAEWEYAARGSRDMAKYPWGNPYIRNSKGCMLANFKPGRGNYYDDGFMYSSPVASYFANDFGLYDMSGNVGEWCEDAFYHASVPVVWDLNPTYFNDAEPRKVVRGGSWKDVAFYLECGTRTFEYQDTTKSYLGFRCAMTYLGRSSGQEF